METKSNDLEFLFLKHRENYVIYSNLIKKLK